MVRVFGEKEVDVELFLALAVQGADVIILDQHLEYGGHGKPCRTGPLVVAQH